MSKKIKQTKQPKESKESKEIKEIQYSISNEFKPELEDKYWDKIDGDKDVFKYNKTIPEVVYNITQNLIDKAKSLTANISEDNNDDYNIYRFYKIYETELNCNIFYSRTSIETIIINDLINHNLGKNKLSDFKNLLDIKYKLLECYKIKKNTNIKKEFDIIKDKLKESNNIIDIKKTTKTNKKDDTSKENTTKTPDNIIDKYKNFVNKFINKTVDKQKYYIYKLIDQKNEAQIYIHGTYNKLKKRDIEELIDTYCIDFESGKIKAEILKEIEIYSELEGKIAVDEEIKNNDSIKSGYELSQDNSKRMNKYYNIVNFNEFNQNELFMMIQQDKINNIKKEKIEKGFIGSINIKNNKYIFSDYNNTIYNKLQYFYSMRKHCEHQYDRLIDLLKITNLEDIKIEILEKNIELNDLEMCLIKYINLYDKDVLLNYNDDYYAKPEDIKKLNNLLYILKNAKK
jgi:hypothetical protein